MNRHTLSCQEAKKIDLVGYLVSLGYYPLKVNGPDFWFFSPFRNEKTASFKVNSRLNVWFDHGEGRGGDLIDFGTLHHRCTVAELLDRLSQYRPSPPFPFQQQIPPGLEGAGEKEGSPAGRIHILRTGSIASQSLSRYLQTRKIPLDIAARTCQEVDFTLYGKPQNAIGFPNRSGGYELRSEHFKGSSSPKDISFIDQRPDEIAVFEGFFDYLSFATLNSNNQAPLTISLVLNSLAFLERSRSLMEQYSRIYLILDQDAAGVAITAKALHWDPSRYIDRSDFYQGYKDLNEWLIKHPPPHLQLNQHRGKGKSLR
jgi:hypothetical protein